MPRRPTGALLAEARWLSGKNSPKVCPTQWSRWIIAGLCCRAVMRWAGLSRRNSWPHEGIRRLCRGRRPGPALPAARRRSRIYRLSAPMRRRREANGGFGHRGSGRNGGQYLPWRPSNSREILSSVRTRSGSQTRSHPMPVWHRFARLVGEIPAGRRHSQTLRG